jgi:hypothetical protein
MKFIKISTLTLALLATWAFAFTPPLEAASSPILARFTYTSPASLAKKTALHLYLVLFDQNNQTTSSDMRLRIVRGPKTKVVILFPMNTSQVIFAVLRSPSAGFSSTSPAVVGTLSVQVNNRSTTRIKLEKFNNKSVIGFFNGDNSTVQNR